MTRSKFTSHYLITMDDIIREGDPVLRAKAESVALPLSEEDRGTLTCMMQFLKNSQNRETALKHKLRSGVGLSANQLGISKRMFVMCFADERGHRVEHTLVNPKIVSHSLSMLYLPESEGCLSVDRPVEGFVPRYESVKLKGFNEHGQPVNLRFKGYAAIVVQHEMDHLDGLMFYDRINSKNPYKLPEGVTIRSLYERDGR